MCFLLVLPGRPTFYVIFALSYLVAYLSLSRERHDSDLFLLHDGYLDFCCCPVFSHSSYQAWCRQWRKVC
jgi:hypothetical protein